MVERHCCFTSRKPGQLSPTERVEARLRVMNFMGFCYLMYCRDTTNGCHSTGAGHTWVVCHGVGSKMADLHWLPAQSRQSATGPVPASPFSARNAETMHGAILHNQQLGRVRGRQDRDGRLFARRAGVHNGALHQTAGRDGYDHPRDLRRNKG